MTVYLLLLVHCVSFRGDDAEPVKSRVFPCLVGVVLSMETTMERGMVNSGDNVYDRDGYCGKVARTKVVTGSVPMCLVEKSLPSRELSEGIGVSMRCAWDVRPARRHVVVPGSARPYMALTFSKACSGHELYLAVPATGRKDRTDAIRAYMSMLSPPLAKLKFCCCC